MTVPNKPFKDQEEPTVRITRSDLLPSSSRPHNNFWPHVRNPASFQLIRPILLIDAASSVILIRPRLMSNYRAGSLLGCRSSLVGLSRRGRLRFLTAIQHNQPDHQETCQEKVYLKSFGFAIHFGLLSKSFAELNLVQTIYDTTKPNLTSPI